VSGFAGIIRLEPTLETAETDRAAIARMAEAIAFRGPDGQQQQVRDGAAFAFSLLTTGPAPQAAVQPVTLDGETFFLGEARVDGRQQLMAKFKQHGEELSPSTCDEELVLRFVGRFGVEALPELDGDFSFILWRSRERKLIAFRDLTGARPFFYSKGNGRLIFSNTLQAILTVGDLSLRNYDPQFIANFLLGAPQYEPERTMYQEIRRLPAGHSLEFSTFDHCVRSIAAYPMEEPRLDAPEEELIDEFRRLLGQAVGDRLPESETSILLSAGLDSTTVASAAVAHRKRHDAAGPLRLRAFTIDLHPLFEEEEGSLARELAESMGLPFELIHAAGVLPLEGMSYGRFKLPEPTDHPYPALQPFYLSHFDSGSRVFFTGDGGDEILRAEGAPFLRYLAARFGRARAAAVALLYLFSRGRLPALGAGLHTGLLRLIGKGSPSPAFPGWITPGFEKKLNLRKRFRKLTAKPWSDHPYHPWSYAKLLRFIPPLMEAQDATFSGRCLEARAPFLDRRLIRFLLRLPPIPWYMNKELLRRAQRDLLPDKIRLRPKAYQNDPLQLHIAAGKWLPKAPERHPAALEGLVDWARLDELLTTAAANELYIHLSPVLIALWLNAVENDRWIQ
jgi:asparagine synthase (glutamine-hydrolysing)